MTKHHRYWTLDDWKNSDDIIDRTVWYISTLSPHNLWKGREAIQEILPVERVSEQTRPTGTPPVEDIRRILGECIGHGYNDKSHGLVESNEECKQFSKEKEAEIYTIFSTILDGLVMEELDGENPRWYDWDFKKVTGYDEAVRQEEQEKITFSDRFPKPKYFKGE